MKNIICLILCSFIAMTLAATPAWYPKDFDEITRKCNEKYLLPSDYELDFSDLSSAEVTKRNAIILCRLKESNLYDDKTGLDVERLKFVFKTTRKSSCTQPVVEECVDKNKEVTSEGERMFRIVMCMASKDMETMRKEC